MGGFSWTCAVCDKGILGENSGRGYSRFRQAVVRWPNGDQASGEYDGYGNIGPIEFLQDQRGGWKIAHAHCAKTKPFEEWGESGHDSYQGFGGSERDNRELYGEPNLDELSYTHYACKNCLKGFTSKFAGGVCELCKAEDSVERVSGHPSEVVFVRCLGDERRHGPCFYKGEVRLKSKEYDEETYEPTVLPTMCSCGGPLEAFEIDWSEAIGVLHSDWNPTHYVNPTPKSYGFSAVPVSLEGSEVLTRDEFIEKRLGLKIEPRFAYRDGEFYEGENRCSSETVEEIRARFV